MTPDPYRPWFRRLIFLPAGSPYWAAHIALLSGFFASMLYWAAFARSGFAVTLACATAIACHGTSTALEFLARRRRPDYYE